MIYYFVKFFIIVLRHLPSRLLYFMGLIFAFAWYYLLPIRKKVLLANLRQAFSEKLSEKEIRLLARKNINHYVLNFIELLEAPVKLNSLTVGKYIDFTDYQRVQGVIEQGGAMILTAHLGNQDILCFATTLHNIPLSIIIRPFKNKVLAKLYEEYRRLFQVKSIPPRNSALKIVRLLKKGEKVGFVLDQNSPPSQGVFVDFLGKPASTFKGLAMFAQSMDIPIVPAFLVREGFWKHRLVAFEPIPFVRSGDKEKELIENTQRYTRVIEEMVLKYPEQWIWVHRRWKTQKK